MILAHAFTLLLKVVGHSGKPGQSTMYGQIIAVSTQPGRILLREVTS